MAMIAPARTASRRPGGSCSRCSTRPAGPPVREGILGAAAPAVAGTAAGTAPGWRMSDKPSPETAPRAPPHRRRSRRSPTTRSCRTATRARSSRPTARSTGCACRASTRRACSARCSTARPAPSGWARSASTSRRRASTSRGRTSLVTTWNTPTGWIVVRDALTMGPRHGEDQITPHTRPPADDDADHMLVRTVALPRGQRRDRARLRAGLRLRPRRRRSGRWSTATATPPTPPAPGQTIRLQTDMALGIEGDRVRARHVLEQGEQALLLAVLGRGPGLAAGRRRGQRAAGRHDAASGAAGWGGRASPTTAGATRSSARRWRSRASPTCRPARPWRRSPPRCPRRPAASATGTTATPGCATRPSRCRRCTTSTSTGRPTSSCSSSPTSSPTRTARCRSCTGSTAGATSPSRRATTCRATPGASPVRIGNGAFDQRQNDVFGAVLDSILLHTRRSQRLPRRLWPIVQAQAECATERLARTRPGHLGGARRAAALRLLEADVLGGAGPRRQAGGDPRRPGARGDVAARPPRRSRRTSSSTASEGRRAAPALRHRRARRLDAAGGDLRLPARRRRAPARSRSRRSPTT